MQPRLGLSGRYRRDEQGRIIYDELHEHMLVRTVSPSSLNAEEEAQVPKAMWYFCLVGIGYLFPFSALTQPVDYWKLLFPDFNLEFPLTTIYMYTNLGALAILVFAGGSPQFTPRIVGGFIGQAFVLIFVPTSYFLGLTEAGNTWAILGATAVAAIVTAFIDSAAIALASQYPLRVQEFFQLGVGISTLIGSLYRDATKAAFPPTMVVESSLLYFYCGAATIVLCIVAYYQLMGLPLSEKCLEKAVEEVKRHSLLASCPQIACMLDGAKEHGEVTEGTGLLSNTNNNKTPIVVDKWDVLRKIMFNEMMVFLLFMSTLALWPPLVTEIPAYTWTHLEASGWWSLTLLTIFSIADCTGRILVRFRCGLTFNNIWIAVLMRLVLFPLIVCSAKEWYFRNDLWSTLFVGLLGATNGYFGTLSIVMVNECCANEAEQALAGMFTGFFLNAGLVLGATIGLLLDRFII